MSLIKDTDFDQRCEDSCKSLSTHVLIVNFKDSHIIVLNYILETPVEITCIEFHPNNTDIVLGGCVNGQVIVWDLRSPEHRIVAGGRKIEVAKMPDEELDKT
jgi:dynein intermediate chain 3, axonemal